ncbi:MAG TPA: M20/M25/M40 family metallo-hydrolase [Gemmatimonadaceae bacterium]|nr:M20/M25/M40 family metallo-hydrolase [Gemmatimonadaceae bacterium]
MRLLLSFSSVLWLALLAPSHAVFAQDNPTGDPVVQRIYDEGMRRSQASHLAQVLLDSIGPRLTGSTANRAANDWLLRTYKSWGIDAKNEQYGTWRDWTRGPSSITLVSPRTRVLEATMHAWSAATPATGVTADVVILPRVADLPQGDFTKWLETAKGKFVLASVPQPTCRPDSDLRFWADSAVYRRAMALRDSVNTEWAARLSAAHANPRTILTTLDHAGVAGILTNSWSRGWGVDKIQSTRVQTVPSFNVSCEDYSLLARLAENGQHPRVHAVAEARLAPAESPVFNTIARIEGSTPNEYVMLSAHLDSWDAGSGATDNGTGTITMLEAMRILKAAYPQPKRTILVGHWSGEEEGDIGSTAFATDHPEIVKGLQALFNQDNGTGEIDTVQTNGFVDAPGVLARWMARMPADLTKNITLMLPGVAHDESTDSDAFDCRDAPAFFLTSSDWSYTDYTWHTNRDTYDKINFDNVKRNATFVAMFAYQASEDPTKVSRTRRVPPTDPSTGQPMRVPKCDEAPRSWSASQRPR